MEEEEVGGGEEGAGGALSLLETGLRSVGAGEKVAAIAGVPASLRRFPFPFFVNAALLRLADTFKSASENGVRLAVVEAAEAATMDWERAISVDEIADRIFAVSYSNDAVARALTLRLLAALSALLHDRKAIHHLISTSLSAGDAQEFAAALIAARQFAHHSPDFCREVFGTLQDLLRDGARETKLRLLKETLPHFHTHPPTARQVVALCGQQLCGGRSGSSSVDAGCVHCLSQLALRSPLVFPSALDSLLAVLRRRRPATLKLASFKQLRLLAAAHPTAWSQTQVEAVLQMAERWGGPRGQQSALSVLLPLARHPSALLWLRPLGVRLLRLLGPLSLAEEPRLALAAAQILVFSAQALRRSKADTDQALAHEATQGALTSLCTILLESDDDGYKTMGKHSRRLLPTLLKTAGLSEDAALVSASLAQRKAEEGRENRRAWLVCLEGLANKFPAVAAAVREWAQQQSDPEPRQLLLTGVWPGEWAVEETWEEAKETRGLPLWEQYELATRAMRNGHSGKAGPILERLSRRVQVDQLRHYLQGLQLLCAADSVLQKSVGVENSGASGLKAVEQAIELVVRGEVELKLAKREMGVEWVRCRLAWLKAAEQVLLVWSSAALRPPPSSLSARGSTASASRLVGQVSNAAQGLRLAAQSWEELRRRAFDADAPSLAALRLSALLPAAAYNAALRVLSANATPISLPPEADCVGCLPQRAQLVRLQSRLQQLSGETERFQSAMERVVSTLLKTVSGPCFYPGLVFTEAQQTRVRMELRGGGGEGGEEGKVLRVASGREVVLRVEGVVRQSLARLRSPSHVVVSLSVASKSSGREPRAKQGRNGGSGEVSRRVRLQNGFFGADMLVQVESSGVVEATIGLVEEGSGALWASPHRAELPINVMTIQTA